MNLDAKGAYGRWKGHDMLVGVLERTVTAEKLVDYDTQTVDIASEIDPLILLLLRRGVGRSVGTLLLISG